MNQRRTPSGQSSYLCFRAEILLPSFYCLSLGKLSQKALRAQGGMASSSSSDGTGLQLHLPPASQRPATTLSGTGLTEASYNFIWHRPHRGPATTSSGTGRLVGLAEPQKAGSYFPLFAFLPNPLSFQGLVPVVGLEPTRISPQDFESSASTISPHRQVSDLLPSVQGLQIDGPLR